MAVSTTPFFLKNGLICLKPQVGVPSGLAKGTLYVDNADGLLVVYDGSVSRKQVNETSVQNISNKVIDTSCSVEGDDQFNILLTDNATLYAESRSSDSVSYISMFDSNVFIGSGDSPDESDLGYLDIGENSAELGSYINDGTIVSRIKFDVDNNDIPRSLLESRLEYEFNSYSGTGTTELAYGKVAHLFSGTAPSGSVKINSTKSGSILNIRNSTVSTLTFIQNSTETFNGVTSFTLAAGKIAMLIQVGTGGAFGVITTG